jgi:hypothetical protein
MSDDVQKLQPSATSLWKGYAVVVAVSRYNEINNLPAAVLNDAKDVASVLTSPVYCGYDSANVRLLLDTDASLANIRNALAWLAAVAGPEDSVVVYFSGHGTRLSGVGGSFESVLLPVDTKLSQVSTTSLSEVEFSAALKAIGSARLLVLLDACHSGGTASLKAVGGQGILDAGFDEKSLAHLAEGVGRVVIASSRATETSLVLKGAHNSVFTQHLLEALRGETTPAGGDGLVRVFQVFDHVAREVPRTTSDTQHPIFKASDLERNFPVALDKGGHKGDAPTASRGVLREFDWQELEKLLSDLYPAGPTDQDIWRRAGGDLSRLRLNQSGRATWFSSLLMLKQGGGGSQLTQERLIEAALDDFPNHNGLKALLNL